MYRFVVELDEIADNALSSAALEWVVAVCADGGLERVVWNAVQDLTTRGLAPVPVAVRVCELEPGADSAPCSCPEPEPAPADEVAEDDNRAVDVGYDSEGRAPGAYL